MTPGELREKIGQADYLQCPAVVEEAVRQIVEILEPLTMEEQVASPYLLCRITKGLPKPLRFKCRNIAQA